VHGTFAPDAHWTKDGSLIRRVIAERLARDAFAVEFDVFRWPGRLHRKPNNSHKDRFRAGRELAARLADRIDRGPFTPHFIVAHSHGGNVAMPAPPRRRLRARL
jgi:alpha-beta hydrolase superfamily lysophospholipase